MKRTLVFFVLLFFIFSGIAYAAGERHHPTGKRYGFVSIPLTSFMNSDGTRIDETSSEGTVSAKAGSAAISVIGGKPVIVLGPGPNPAKISAT